MAGNCAYFYSTNLHSPRWMGHTVSDACRSLSVTCFVIDRYRREETNTPITKILTDCRPSDPLERSLLMAATRLWLRIIILIPHNHSWISMVIADALQLARWPRPSDIYEGCPNVMWLFRDKIHKQQGQNIIQLLQTPATYVLSLWRHATYLKHIPFLLTKIINQLTF